LRSTIYGTPADVWGAAAIVAEIATRTPLTPGGSDADMLHRITALIGPCSESQWSEGMALAARSNTPLPAGGGAALVPSLRRAGCSAECAALLAEILKWEPKRRPTYRHVAANSGLYRADLS
jgi:protein kinase